MKRLLNDAQLATIANAVQAAEKHTRAEIVTVLAPGSDDYRLYALLWSAPAALLISALVSALEWAWSAPAWLGWLPLLAVALTVLLTVLLQIPALLRLLVPRRVLRQRAAALARTQFLAQNLHHTRGETGVLVFVSEFERYVEVLVDRGVATQIDNAQWQQIVDQCTAQVKAGQVEAGFVGAITGIGKLLAEKLPPENNNPNELPNRLVVLR